MEINIEKLEQLKVDADKIFISPEGEKVLLDLLDLEQQVKDAIDMAKAKLEETALKLNPAFKSIQADRIKVYYRSYGSQYKIDETFLTNMPQEFYKVTASYSPVGDTIEAYFNKNGKLPVGIIEPIRPKKLSFSDKEKKGKDEV